MAEQAHISELTLTLGVPAGTRISLAQASSFGPLLQGALMEHVDHAYAAWLHVQPFNPYSQYCVTGKRDGTLAWHITALNDEALRQILVPLQTLDSITLHKVNMTFTVQVHSLTTTTLKSITDEISSNTASYAKVEFVTPTAFKSAGRYVIVPNVRLIFQNLLMQYGQMYETSDEADQDTVDYIDKNVWIRSYHLHSQRMEHVNPQGRAVSGFVGDLSLSIKGPQPLVGLVHMLLRFGEYAGVGIKTSMGMGGMRCL